MDQYNKNDREYGQIYHIDAKTKADETVCESSIFLFFFFQAEDGIRDVAVTGVQTCALPISAAVQTDTPKRTTSLIRNCPASSNIGNQYQKWRAPGVEKRKLTVNRNVMIAPMLPMNESLADRKSTRLNSSHGYISYAVFCLKKKKNNHNAGYVLIPLKPCARAHLGLSH